MRTLVIATAVVSAACSTDPVSLADYDAAAHEAYCRHYARCGIVESIDTCHEVGLDVAISLDASLRAAVEAGKARYDGARAVRCLDAFAERSCDVTSQSSRAVPDDCFQEFSGTQHDGDACAFDGECISRDCNKPSCSMACCPGSCVGDTPPGRAGLGESCEIAHCEANAFCDEALTCAALKPSGAPCVSPSECQYGLDCGATNTCTRLPALGEACSGACRDEGTTCSSTSGTCVKVALAGEPCATSTDCSQLYRCDATRHCSTGLALGATCTASQHCAGERAFCDVPDGATMGSCSLPQPDGSPCQRDASCESLHCDPFTLQCAPAPVCF